MAITTLTVNGVSTTDSDMEYYSYATAYKVLADESVVTLGSFPGAGPSLGTYTTNVAVPATAMTPADGLRFVARLRILGYGGDRSYYATTNLLALGWGGLDVATWGFTRTVKYMSGKIYLTDASISGISYVEGGPSGGGIVHPVIGSSIVNSRAIVRGAA
jgi:hypothetical protein